MTTQSTVAARETPAAGLPNYETVLLLPREVAGTVVPPAFEDENGHMNIRHYFDLSALAISTVFERMGIDDEYRSTRKLGFFTAEHHLKYFSEVRIGETVAVHFAFLERSDKVLHGISVLVNDTARQVSNTLEFVATHVDLTTRRVTPFDAETATVIDREFAKSADIHWTAPVCGSMGVRRR
jgi:acyl-CoA thioester hydrolase